MTKSAIVETLVRKILILTANPKNTSRLRLDEEVREIQEGLQRSRSRDQVEIVSRWAVRTDDLRRALLDHEPQIVHFCGHGAGADGLALEDNSGQMQLVSSEAIARLFKLFQGTVECVVLNACYSEVQAEAIHQHIDYVIGMSDEIGDRAAIKFAVGFYDGIGANRSYEDAFEFGLNAIDLEGLPETLTPQLKRRDFSDSSFKLDNLEQSANDSLRLIKDSSHQKYLQTYLKRHGNIQILGMSREIPLEEIYTRVFMLDPETIRGFETVEGLEQHYRKTKQRGFNQNNSKTESGMDVANAEPYLCVLGGPGIGKTTYLRKIGLEALLSKEGQYQHELIPVFLELKTFTSPDLNLKDEITHEFDISGLPDASKCTDKALQEGSLLILLDGLDEVPADNVNRVIRAIKDLSDQYAKNRFMVSCRIAAYHSYLKGFRNVAIAEFTKEQMGQFISNWFLADPNPGLTTEVKIKNGRDCWQQLQDSTSIPTEELSQTPLLLTFICIAYRNSQTITDNRAVLYTEALDILLKEWYKEKALEKSWEIYQYLPPRLEKELLAEIAYVGLEEDKLFLKKDDLAQQISTFLEDTPNAPKHIDADKVIDAITVQQGIFVERAMGVYSFSHLTLQEYLCAEYIIKWSFQDRLVKKHVTDNRWREVFLLIPGLMGGAAISFIEKLEVQTHQAILEHITLKGLLTWAEAKTTYSTSGYSGETKRIFALLLIFYLVSERTLAVINCHTRNGSNINMEFILPILNNIDKLGPITLNIASTLNTSSILNFNSNHDALNISKFAYKNELFVNVDISSLIKCLESTAEQRSLDEELALNSKIYQTLDLSPDLQHLSDSESIMTYLSTCQLMIDCSKQASGLSKNDWNAIQQRMFLPLHPKNHENSSPI